MKSVPQKKTHQNVPNKTLPLNRSFWPRLVSSRLIEQIVAMQFNPQDVSRSFLFLPHLDAFGTDMRRVHGTLETILATAYHNPDCYAVNTLGFLKCNISSVMPSDFLRGSQDGVYVKISLLP
jgi:hypothetical protein